MIYILLLAFVGDCKWKKSNARNV